MISLLLIAIACTGKLHEDFYGNTIALSILLDAITVFISIEVGRKLSKH